MMNKPILRNKGSSNELNNFHHLDEPNHSPFLKLLSSPASRHKEANIQIWQTTCREIRDHFIAWFLLTILTYVKCFILLVLTFLIFLVKEKISDTMEAKTLFSILGSFSFIWLIIEWIEAYINFSIKGLLKYWFNKLGHNQQKSKE